MTRMQLLCHPATPMPSVDTLEIVLSPGSDGSLAVCFSCRCPAGLLRLPEARPAAPADELWRHTCCELFVGVTADVAYREFNWSPSGQWAAYAFSAYRMRAASGLEALPPPGISFESNAQGWTLRAQLAAAALTGAAATEIELGVAVVLEAADGNMSYWALQHASARPDFHRRESFILRLSDLA
jgi:hypothetical protein